MTRKPRPCAMCSKIITHSKTGLCRSHAAKQALQDAELRQRRVEAQREALARPEVRELWLRNCRAAAQARLAWCPIEYRDEYRRLAGAWAMNAAEARRMIEDLIQADAARYARTGQLQQTRRAA